MKSHHQYHLPAGCHDAATAAELLGISKVALLKRMRELGWLIVSGDQRNLPRREYIQRGWLNTQERGYALKGKREITKTYQVMLLTQLGFQELKKIMEHQTLNNTPVTAPAQPKAPTPAPATQTTTPEQRAAADAERKKALAQLREWGLTG